MRVFGKIKGYVGLIAATFMFAAGLATHVNAQGYVSDLPGHLILVSSAASKFEDVQAYPDLLQHSEQKSKNISPFIKWTSMFDRFEKDIQKQGSDEIIKAWKKELIALKGLPLKDLADQVNRYVNQTPYILDQDNWGKSDYWATPIEFFTRGGDCEDYAIAKYAALRMLGVPESRLRLAIVHDNEKNIPHAVLIVYTNTQAYILDNQTENLVNAAYENRYRPIFSINRTAWWLHSIPENTVLASAQ